MAEDETKRLLILISGRGSNMDALAAACERGEVRARVVAVISDRDAAGLSKARERGIETRVVDYRQYDDAERFDRALRSACAELSPDLIALAGFMRVLSARFVAQFAGRILNIHPSLLPKYTGLNTHRRVLAEGDATHGCSVHFVTERLDAGPIVIQDAVDVRADDTPESLARRVIRREHLIYPYAVGLFCADRLAMNDGACELDGERLTTPLSLPPSLASESAE